VDFRRRHIQPQSCVVESAGADPADTTLNGVQYRQQVVSLGAGWMAGTANTRIAGGRLRSKPARIRRAQHGINGGTFFACGLRAGKVKVQSVLPIAHRENLDVPQRFSFSFSAQGQNCGWPEQ
jgi:hypothetical protein